jgi:hypothetical protein
MTSKVARFSKLFPTDPVSVTGGALTCWLSNTTLSGAISSVPDILSPAAPATQGTAARQPTGNADGTMSFSADDVLVVPFNANTISTTTQGYCFWLKLDAAVSVQVPVSMTAAAGGSTSRGRLEVGGALGTGGAMRTAGTIGAADSIWAAGTIVAGTWQFICLEYDGGAALGSRMNLFVDNVLKTNTSDSMPAALTATSGTWCVGAIDTSGANGITGRIGRNVFLLNAKMADATQGLLTTHARRALMDYQRPT